MTTTLAPTRKRTKRQVVKHTVLQSLLWPEQGIITEHPLFFRLAGLATFTDDRTEIRFEPGSHAVFDTYANFFNLGKWQRSTQINDLRLHLVGSGTFELVVFQILPERSWERLVNRVIHLDTETEVDISHFLRAANAGLVFFSLTALDKGHLSNAAWVTHQPPRQTPQIALSITTFRREDAVRDTVDRFNAFMAKTTLAPYLHLIVVDNGQSAGITPSAHVTPIPNANLGGSGGFARGLIEAETRGATHCIFMDDDASILLGAIERVWAFLAYSTDPATAVAGALAMANHRWSIWENGAVFDKRCHPQWLGTDMRDATQVQKMELNSVQRPPHNFYGGWWFFAFPIVTLRHRPFPFFVRGDDISFSLANGFDIVTLPGVICFQDADFSDKESLQTLYLDLRNHLIHHLALPSMDIGRRATIGIASSFFLRSLLQCHYETLKALNLAIEDVIRGPAFFAANADMSARRTTLASFRKVEAWTPLTNAPPPPRLGINVHGNGIKARFWRATLNATFHGHLLPFFGSIGNHLTLRAGQRGDIRAMWGASRVTYISADGTQSFTTRHSKRKALAQSLRLARNIATLALRFTTIRGNWRKGYADLTTRDFWISQLDIKE